MVKVVPPKSLHTAAICIAFCDYAHPPPPSTNPPVTFSECPHALKLPTLIFVLPLFKAGRMPPFT